MKQYRNLAQRTSSKQRTLRPEDGDFIVREHDMALRDLVSSGKRGNYLLVGLRGSGRTTSLRAISDQLIDHGREHQVIARAYDSAFVPLMAKVNLVDNLDAAPISNFELIKALNGSRKRSLNIITSRSSDSIAGLDIDGIIEISPPTSADLISMLDRLSAGSIPSDRYLETVRRYLSNVNLVSLGELQLLATALVSARAGFVHRPAFDSEFVDRARPALVQVRDTVLGRLSGRPNELFELAPREFEFLIGELFEKEGYLVDFTKRSRDGGVDIFATRRDIGGQSLTIVQCKRNSPSNPVRVQIVREVVGTMSIHDATAGAIFTTSRFTAPATEEAGKLKYKLSLNDYLSIIHSIIRHKT
jgi:Restriction endonuclease